jgi:pyruvate decarboxylase
MSDTIKLAEYLFTRLKKLGIGAVHGVPGDYNLDLLDYVESSGLLWVGNANELNAGYAADGYARIKGAGALITTYGVGELSAINAMACAYTEHAAVVHIMGTPSRTCQDERLVVHHTLGHGDYRHFSQMHSHVTVAQTNLVDPRTSPGQIDGVLRQCILHSRPVYIEIPMDMVDVLVPAETLRSQISIAEPLPEPAHESMLAKVLERMYAAKRPLILVDSDLRALGLLDTVQDLVLKTKWPTFTTISGKGLIDMTLSNVHGIYRGSYADESVKRFVDGADLVLCFGPHFSSTNSHNWSALPKSEISVLFTQPGIKIGHELFRDIPAKYAAAQLLQRLDVSELATYETHLEVPRDSPLSF